MQTIITRTLSGTASAAVMLVLISGTASLAQNDTITQMRAGKGLEIAKLWCAHCHQVDPSETSEVVSEAPGFYDIANLEGQNQTRVELFLTQPTHPMPDLNLTREEIENLAIYIMTLREPTVGGGD